MVSATRVGHLEAVTMRNQRQAIRQDADALMHGRLPRTSTSASPPWRVPIYISTPPEASSLSSCCCIWAPGLLDNLYLAAKASAASCCDFVASVSFLFNSFICSWGGAESSASDTAACRIACALTTPSRHMTF
eukprot:scaffold194185_cov31-Tisochrysis_lutea.AAC.1